MKAVTIIKREHRNLGAVLTCLELLVRDIGEEGRQPDFRVFHAILTYLDSFLDRYHHPKEDEHLFPALRRRYPESEAILQRLEAQHEDAIEMTDEVRRALSTYEFAGDDAFPAFRDLVMKYVSFERDHAYTEEREVLPLAREHLTEQDWESIDAAFEDNEDPLFGDTRRKEYGKLASVIANLTPAPHGLGAKWKSRS